MWPFSSPTPTIDSPESSVTTSRPPIHFAYPTDSAPEDIAVGEKRYIDPVDPYKDVTLSSLHWTGYSNERLAITPIIRGPILMAMAFATGLVLGSATAGQRAADRYRAQPGWYLYQRTKSYHTVIGGVKRGAGFGCVLSLWAAGFMVTEEGVDQMRSRVFRRDGEEVRLGQRDVLSTVVAAMATAGVYSRVMRLDKYATVQASRMALKGGVGFGLCQDLVACLRSEPPAYVRWIGRRLGGTPEREIKV